APLGEAAVAALGPADARKTRYFEGLGLRSAPAEQALDIGELQLDIGWAPMVALAGMGCFLHLAQKCIHFVKIEAATGTHTGMAGERAADMLKTFLERQRFAQLGELVGKIAHEALDVDFTDERRHLAHDERTRAEGFEKKAELRQLILARKQAIDRPL